MASGGRLGVHAALTAIDSAARLRLIPSRVVSWRTALLSFVLVLVSAESASAVTLTSPPDGAATNSTPTFAWQLAPGEDASFIEMAPNPAPGSLGGFAQDQELRVH